MLMASCALSLVREAERLRSEFQVTNFGSPPPNSHALEQINRTSVCRSTCYILELSALGVAEGYDSIILRSRGLSNGDILFWRALKLDCSTSAGVKLETVIMGNYQLGGSVRRITDLSHLIRHTLKVTARRIFIEGLLLSCSSMSLVPCNRIQFLAFRCDRGSSPTATTRAPD